MPGRTVADGGEGHELLAELMPRERKARLVVEDYAKKFAAEGNPAILLDDVLAAAMEKTADAA